MIETITIKWDLLGAKLASMSDVEQSLFFTGFAKELDSWPTHLEKEVQMISVNKKLKEDVKKTLEAYFPALWYKEAQC